MRWRQKAFVPHSDEPRLTSRAAVADPWTSRALGGKRAARAARRLRARLSPAHVPVYRLGLLLAHATARVERACHHLALRVGRRAPAQLVLLQPAQQPARVPLLVVIASARHRRAQRLARLRAAARAPSRTRRTRPRVGHGCTRREPGLVAVRHECLLSPPLLLSEGH